MKEIIIGTLVILSINLHAQNPDSNQAIVMETIRVSVGFFGDILVENIPGSYIADPVQWDNDFSSYTKGLSVPSEVSLTTISTVFKTNFIDKISNLEVKKQWTLMEEKKHYVLTFEVDSTEGLYFIFFVPEKDMLVIGCNYEKK